MKNPSVMVGIPSGDAWSADFGMSLAGLVAAAPMPLKGGGQIERLQLWNTKGSILSRSRHTLAQQSLELKCDYLLMLDSDMTFPSYALHQLLAANVEVVAANCSTKGSPAYPTARNKGNTPAGSLVHSEGKKSLERVWRIGTGVMLIKTSVFEKLPQPWFPITWEAQNNDYTGEDWNFCKLCAEHGIPVYVDHLLSQQIGHIGSFNYEVRNIEEQENE